MGQVLQLPSLAPRLDLEPGYVLPFLILGLAEGLFSLLNAPWHKMWVWHGDLVLWTNNPRKDPKRKTTKFVAHRRHDQSDSRCRTATSTTVPWWAPPQLLMLPKLPTPPSSTPSMWLGRCVRMEMGSVVSLKRLNMEATKTLEGFNDPSLEVLGDLYKRDISLRCCCYAVVEWTRMHSDFFFKSLPIQQLWYFWGNSSSFDHFNVSK